MLSWLHGVASSTELAFSPQLLSSSGMEARTVLFLQLLPQVLVVENDCRKTYPVPRQLTLCYESEDNKSRGGWIQRNWE